MKRYSVSYARFVNENASKSGIKFQYSERTDNPEEYIERYKDSNFDYGMRITDSKTKKVIFEDLRPIKGILYITFKSRWSEDNGSFTYTKRYVDLKKMREDEHYYKYRKDVIKVEREILSV